MPVSGEDTKLLFTIDIYCTRSARGYFGIAAGMLLMDIAAATKVSLSQDSCIYTS